MEAAVRTAAMDMISLLRERLGLDFPDAYRLLSAACDVRVSQVVNGVYTLKVRAPKRLFAEARRIPPASPAAADLLKSTH